MPDSIATAAAIQRRDIAAAVLETLGIVAIFALAAGWPIPDVNETHYLIRAMHHWRPDFLHNDFVLQSPETHGTFYALFGWLTVALPLEWAAWCGRLLSWSLLAVGWRRLSIAVVPGPGVSIATAALYVTLTECTHMAGEWVVGGFESKGIAYALVFAGLGELARRRWNVGLGLLGAATAMHVLVGGWSIVAAGVCWLWQGSERPSLRSIWPGLMVAGALALAGVWPALAMNRGVDPAVVAEANQIYVFQRLPHHLTPLAFKLEFIERHSLLVCIWVALCAFTPRDAAQRVIRGFVAGALGITLIGIAISLVLYNQPVLAASLLRFYWFRLGDVVVPLGVALVGGAFVRSTATNQLVLRRAFAVIVAALVLWRLGEAAAARLYPGVPRADAVPNKVLDADAWRAACLWVRDHTPADAVVLAPRSAQSFKWWARRAEVGNWKDIPQNARDLVQWRQRMEAIHATHSADPLDQWYDSLAEAGAEHAAGAARQYGASYLLTAADPPLALPILYRNEFYAVYAVPAEP